jgi:exosortase family protein XrtF
MKKLEQIKKIIEPYRGIIRFLLAMFIANMVWKISITEDEHSVGEVLLWNFADISGFFRIVVRQASDSVYFILHDVLGMNVIERNFIFRFDTGAIVRIVWGCSGVKQMFIFTVIMLFSYGSWKHKLWFIPGGILICHGVNILRILLLALIAYRYPAQMDLFHTYIFKYAFYGIIFLMWIVWNEKFGYEKIRK